MEDILKCYKVLDVTPGATPAEIRKAYVSLAHVWHPDRFEANPVLREKAREKMREVEDAYHSLATFLPALACPRDPGQVAPSRPERVEEITDVSNSGTSQKVAIAFFLGALIVGIVILGIVLGYRGRGVIPVQFP